MLKELATEFVDVMKRRGVSEDMALKATESGYVVAPSAPTLTVMDCHYGYKASGLFNIDDFANYLKGVQPIERSSSGVAVYRNVRDLQELQEIASQPRHQRYISQGMTSFRGQVRDYWMTRPVPNPRTSDDQQRERIVIPSYWRAFLERPLIERNWGPADSIFKTILADPLVYHGIPDWQGLPSRNYERYGIHSVSDLEDFPEHENQEYFRRYMRHKVMPSSEYPLIEQHYGQSTIGLDVTFDLATAAFFASHRWVGRQHGKATYEAIEPGQHGGVIYFFTFRDPLVKKTEYLVRELNVFQHVPPIRPVRQQCGLPAFHANEISAAVRDLDAVLFLAPNFMNSGLPEAPYLFPVIDDPFYRALIEQKRRLPEVWDWVVEYEF